MQNTVIPTAIATIARIEKIRDFFVLLFILYTHYIPKKNESKKYVGRVRMKAIIENINRITDKILKESCG